ncbi:MAG: hypothetical protein RLY31_1581 [Bacteroidota bacterium]|jgi:uncharacterized protein (TIGR03643 family)
MESEGQAQLSREDIERIIEMAWEDRTPFDAIERQFGLPEPAVIRLMRRELAPKHWRRWRKRVHGRVTKHTALRTFVTGRHKSGRQREISRNRVSKRAGFKPR